MENDNIQEEKKMEETTENVENKDVEVDVTAEAKAEEPVFEEKKTDAEHEQGKKKKSRFGFSDRRLKDELAESNRKLEELQDKYMRQVAELATSRSVLPRKSWNFAKA